MTNDMAGRDDGQAFRTGSDLRLLWIRTDLRKGAYGAFSWFDALSGAGVQ